MLYQTIFEHCSLPHLTFFSSGLESGDQDATTEEPDILTTHGSTDGHTTHGHTTHGPTTHGPHKHGPTTHEPTTHTHTTQPHGQGTTQAATATGMTQEDTTQENKEVGSILAKGNHPIAEVGRGKGRSSKSNSHFRTKCLLSPY